MMSYGGSYSGIGFMILMLVFLILIIIGVIFLIYYLWPPSRHTATSDRDILKQRYARGEIDDEEFERRKKGLL
ncbi:MAG: SHOCT domain-containing protein [Acidimicrobiales bacterium]